MLSNFWRDQSRKNWLVLKDSHYTSLFVLTDLRIPISEIKEESRSPNISMWMNYAVLSWEKKQGKPDSEEIVLWVSMLMVLIVRIYSSAIPILIKLLNNESMMRLTIWMGIFTWGARRIRIIWWVLLLVQVKRRQIEVSKQQCFNFEEVNNLY